MESNVFSAVAPSAERAPQAEGRAWRVVPLEGTFALVYEDGRGIWSSRVLDARELKLGPGRTLLCGLDRARGLYRGFRADRIRRLSEPETGLRLETGILDHLLARAEVQRRARGTRERSVKRSQGPNQARSRARSTARSGHSPRVQREPSV